MFLPYGTACAGAILRPWAGERRSRVAGTTREPFDEPTTQKRPALRVACGRAPASLRRSSDVPASPFAARLADRLARTQRRLLPYGRNMLCCRACPLTRRPKSWLAPVAAHRLPDRKRS